MEEATAKKEFSPFDGHPEFPQGEAGEMMLQIMNEGKHEQLALWGLAFLPLAGTERVLDVGCGGGANLARLLARLAQGSVCGVDCSPLSVQMSRSHNAEAISAGRCSVEQGSCEALPFEDSSFDAICAFETVYFWDILPALREVRRVLKPGGRFLVCNEDNGYTEAGRQAAARIKGMRTYKAEDLACLAMAAGFTRATCHQNKQSNHLALVFE